MKTFLRVLALISFLGICAYGVAQVKPDRSIGPNLINGEPVDIDDWRMVVRIRTGNSGCSATVVGPKAVITAAHCGNNGSTSTFSLAGKSYSGRFYRSGLYPRRDHDMAVIVLSDEIPLADVKSFASVGENRLEIGDPLYLLGYGCVRPGGGGGNDGILRAGFTKVTGYSGYDVVSSDRNGAALCYGDSGGPGMTDDKFDKPILRTVNSKGNIRDTNYTTNLSSSESQSFLREIEQEHNVVVCGITESLLCNGEDEDEEEEEQPNCMDAYQTVKAAEVVLSDKIDQLGSCIAQ